MDAYVAKLMEAGRATADRSSELEAAILDEVKRCLHAGATLVPDIVHCMGLDLITAKRVEEWIGLGFDLNTWFPCDPGATPNTLLGHYMNRFDGTPHPRASYGLVDVLCKHGAWITPDMYTPKPGDSQSVDRCREIARAHHHVRCIQVRRGLIVLLAAQVVHPDMMRGLKGFLI